MSEAAVYEANHGTWKLGPRAVDEQYALLTFEGTVVQAIEIDRVERVAETVPGREGSSRSVIHGKVLQPGGRVYDAYVDQPSPVPPGRNPVRYYDEP
ncbi:hypothetical protein [Cryptosporangium aurantiacum]|nr:hypothetical protein [Cryptosporangium aurantiacum]